MTHEDGEETVRTGSTPGRRNITAKFLRQKVAWHERNVKTNVAGEGCVGGIRHAGERERKSDPGGS